MEIIELSVHDIVDFVLRSGDIDSRVFNVTTMNEGSRLHRIFQDEQDSTYKSEVFLKYDFLTKDYCFRVSGRCDGLIVKNNEVTIDEIKTTNEDIKKFYKENKKRHLGQAEFYALIYCELNNIDKINIRLSYISQITEKILYFNYKYTKSKLNKVVYSYLNKYEKFLNVQKNFNKIKFKSLKKLEFPFKKTRIGQKEMIDLTLEAIKNKENYFYNAPTGIGKTMSLVYGSLNGLNKKYCNKIFYLTAKNSGFLSAINSLNILYENNLRLKSIVITSKEKICINKNKNKACNPDECIFAKEYYKKIFEITIDSLRKYDFFDKETILKIANEYQVCPFELSLDLSNRCDFIICDYNYLYDPIAYLRRYFDEEKNDQKNFILVDESHNLIDRSRNMYSASINKKDIINAKNELKKIKSSTLKNNLIRIIKIFEEYESLFEDNGIISLNDLNDKLIRNIDNFKNNYRLFKQNNVLEKTIELDNLSLSFLSFLTIYDFFNNDNYKLDIEKTSDNLIISLNCLDASRYIKRISDEQASTIFFSATMNPINYYKKLILGNENYKDFIFKSPFDNKNLLVLVNKEISLKYKDRNLTISNVIYEINEFIKNKIGNYLIFLPSFEYLLKVKEIVEKSELFLEYDKEFQSKNMTNLEKEEFLNKFRTNPSKTNLGFCVLGGSFSEGVDLVNDRLIGAVIVGVGLPTISYSNKELEEYFNSIELNGFEYTYTYPGINKVLQAIGRIIRTEKDKGIALLIDKRYGQKNYRFLFDEIYKNHYFIEYEDEISEKVKNFYK